METDVSDADKPFPDSSLESDATLESDLYDTDNFDAPDPGLLEEAGELAWPSLRRDFRRSPKRLGQPVAHRAPSGAGPGHAVAVVVAVAVT